MVELHIFQPLNSNISILRRREKHDSFLLFIIKGTQRSGRFFTDSNWWLLFICWWRVVYCPLFCNTSYFLSLSLSTLQFHIHVTSSYRLLLLFEIIIDKSRHVQVFKKKTHVWGPFSIDFLPSFFRSASLFFVTA